MASFGTTLTYLNKTCKKFKHELLGGDFLVIDVRVLDLLSRREDD